MLYGDWYFESSGYMISNYYRYSVEKARIPQQWDEFNNLTENQNKSGTSSVISEHVGGTSSVM